MKKAKEFISNHSLELEWDDSAAQYYGEFVASDDTLTQIWMEDAASIEQKINVMKANDIGGVAAWSLGMETSDIWDVISDYVEG